MTLLQSRRGFLEILAGVIAGPSIVRASNLMPIKVTDTYHIVRIKGLDIHGNEISEYIKVVESLASGINMDGYTSATKLIQPKFKSVLDISWTKDLMRPTSLSGDISGWENQNGKDWLAGKRIYDSRTNVYQPDAPPLEYHSAMRQSDCIPNYALSDEHISRPDRPPQRYEPSYRLSKDQYEVVDPLGSINPVPDPSSIF